LGGDEFGHDFGGKFGNLDFFDHDLDLFAKFLFERILEFLYLGSLFAHQDTHFGAEYDEFSFFGRLPDDHFGDTCSREICIDEIPDLYIFHEKIASLSLLFSEPFRRP
jgi:hypothetical protein